MESTTLKSHKITILIVAAAIIIISIFAYLYVKSKKENDEIMTVMNAEKEDLTNEYKNLAMDYEPLRANNDSLNSLLTKEKERIAQLIEEIQTIKATNASKIREYKKELGSLRTVLKSYIVQIDSLNQSNKALTEENKKYRQRVDNMQTTYHKLEKVKKTLEKKVDIASKLETFNMEARGLNSRDRETSHHSRISKIRICFTIQKNITAEVGEKLIYLRLLRPDGALLYHNKTDLFTYENQEINFSSKRSIEYGGDELDVCIYYNVDSGELTAGSYTADIFADGRNIGTMSFKLK